MNPNRGETRDIIGKPLIPQVREWLASKRDDSVPRYEPLPIPSWKWKRMTMLHPGGDPGFKGLYVEAKQNPLLTPWNDDKKNRLANLVRSRKKRDLTNLEQDMDQAWQRFMGISHE